MRLQFEDPSGTNPAQHAYLNSFAFVNFLFAGRGMGKTASAIVKAVSALHDRRVAYGAVGIITATTVEQVRTIIMPQFERIVPCGIYDYNKSERCVRFANGAKLYLMTRMSAQSVRQPGRGYDAAFVIHDEIALDADLTPFHTFLGTLRHPAARIKFCDIITTPKLGPLYDLAQRYGVHDSHFDRQDAAGATVWAERRGVATFEDKVSKSTTERSVRAFYGRTASNPHNDGLATMLGGVYDASLAAQELEAQWVTLSGRLWDNWSDAEAPAGNLTEYRWTPGQSWALSCDFGARSSAWIAWQQISIAGVARWVAVREWMFDEAGVDQCLTSIKADVDRPPSAVYCGHDVGSRSVSDLQTPRHYILHHLGYGPRVVPLSSAAMDPRVRYSRARHGICADDGVRRCLVSRHLISHDPSRRGILRVIAEDAWPKKGESYMSKDGRLEHCRDAWHHIWAAVDPPLMRVQGSMVPASNGTQGAYG